MTTGEIRQDDQDDIIRVISFNLKRDFGFGKKNKWNQRRQLAAEVIKNSGASIIGVQELLPMMKSDVQSLLTDYRILGWGRYYGQKPKDDEHSDIIVKHDDLEVFFCKTFWLSKKPEEYATRGLFSCFPRICTVAEVRFKKNNRWVRVFNTHFDHISGMARVLGVRIILDYIHRFNQADPMPTILMGDMNAKPHSRSIQLLRENSYNDVHLTDCYTLLDQTHLKNTLHNFSGKAKEGKNPIDYIFVSDDFEVLNVDILTDRDEKQYPSDHFPICATLRFKQK